MLTAKINEHLRRDTLSILKRSATQSEANNIYLNGLLLKLHILDARMTPIVLVYIGDANKSASLKKGGQMSMTSLQMWLEGV